MATPHVTGVAALVLATTPGATPATVSQAITAASDKGVVRTSNRYRSANNNLLFSSF
jgi:subtilisin family serine protease